jgi:PIN domain nuclease of toxin-antitoxin system
LTLLDANALIAALLDEPARGEVAELLRNGGCAIPASCLSEVVAHLLRKHRVPEQLLAERLDPLIDEAVAVLDVDSRVAWRAGELRAAHYHRKTADLSLADCLLLASAGPKDEIATSDRAVVATARELGIGVIPLPDSNGDRPPV